VSASDPAIRLLNNGGLQSFYTGGTGTVTTVDALPSDGRASYHVFPQFADGQMVDGTYYRSTTLISNANLGQRAICQIQLQGMSRTFIDMSGQVVNDSFVIEAGRWTILSTSGAGRGYSFGSGYLTVKCDVAVNAQILYGFYTPNGFKLSEATVFSAPGGTWAQLLGDQREGAHLGIAIANDSDSPVQYEVEITDPVGAVLANRSFQLGPRASRAQFIEELIGFYSPMIQIVVKSSIQCYVMGLRFTGSTFTTIPAATLQR